ncbi:MAG: pyridoxal-phosphate dependent enzyme, partial [Emcibacteraceae bacterium]|nr:pyridoxal-phosphate dependent enzyme [Emcibacteraceae bacterium]
MLTDKFPRAILAHTPTPIDRLDNLSKLLGGITIYVKRDDCTGLAFGGNKARQLEYYFGEAVRDKADTILITGAVQSNYSRTAVAAARKYGMEAEVQLEER